MKILFVDDDSDDRSLFCEAVKLIDENIDCELAEDGEIALDKLNKSAKQPDLIFLDINMPVLDGKECLSQIRSSDKLKDIPVVICSTSVDQREINRFRSLGVPYIVKPPRFDSLVGLLEQYINSVRQQQLRPITVKNR